MLRGAHGIHDGPGLARGAGPGIQPVNLVQLCFRYAGDPGDGGLVIASVLPPEELQNAVVVQLSPGCFLVGRPAGPSFPVGSQQSGFCGGGGGVGVLPCGRVVLASGPAAEEPVLSLIAGQLDGRIDDVGGIGVVLDVLEVIVRGVEPHVIQDVVNHSAHEGDVGARPDTHICVGPGRRAAVARVNMDDPGAAGLRLKDVLHAYGMVLCRIGADDQDAVGVLDIDPVVGHCPSAERLCQSRNSRGMSEAGAVFEVHHA